MNFYLKTFVMHVQEHRNRMFDELDKARRSVKQLITFVVAVAVSSCTPLV